MTALSSVHNVGFDSNMSHFDCPPCVLMGFSPEASFFFTRLRSDAEKIYGEMIDPNVRGLGANHRSPSAAFVPFLPPSCPTIFLYVSLSVLFNLKLLSSSMFYLFVSPSSSSSSSFLFQIHLQKPRVKSDHFSQVGCCTLNTTSSIRRVCLTCANCS